MAEQFWSFLKLTHIRKHMTRNNAESSECGEILKVLNAINMYLEKINVYCCLLALNWKTNMPTLTIWFGNKCFVVNICLYSMHETQLATSTCINSNNRSVFRLPKAGNFNFNILIKLKKVFLKYIHLGAVKT